jgi:GTP-binding protein
MKFVDVAKIHVKSGDGGPGCVSFRREAHVPRGGPDGGDGGKGGDLVFRGDPGKSTLLDFHFQHRFEAKRGGHGMGKDRHGKNGTDSVIDVPFGTVVKDFESGEVLMEVLDERPRVLLRGGIGGKGNAHFKSSTLRAPKFAQPGRPGEERRLTLELKLIADVGLVGFPNAGKSTLISRISKARPKIADYPFTTLVPNLGVAQSGHGRSFVVADIPGLIEGASEGAGLGLQFLRHIERTALLVILLDPSPLAGREPWDQYRILLNELGKHSAALLEKPRVVAVNKADLFPGARVPTAMRSRLVEAGERVYAISAVTGKGVPKLVKDLGRAVAAARPREGRAPELSPKSRARLEPPAAPHTSASTRRRSAPPPRRAVSGRRAGRTR